MRSYAGRVSDLGQIPASVQLEAILISLSFFARASLVSRLMRIQVLRCAAHLM